MEVPDSETPKAFYSELDDQGDLMIHYCDDPVIFRHSKAAGVDHNTRNNAGRTVLMEHAAAGHTGMMEVIFQIFGTDGINLQDPHGDTALHLAARGLRQASVTALLNHGADATIANRQGWPPLLSLLKVGAPFPPVMVWELSRPPVRPVVVTAAMFLAVKADNAAAMPALLVAGADISGRNRAGLTPFLAACAAGSDVCAKMLVHWHPDCAEDLSADGKTAIDLARSRGHSKVLAYLNALAENCSTPLGGLPVRMAVAGCLPEQAVRSAIRQAGPRSREGTEALALALADMKISLARILIEEGVDPHSPQSLIVACRANNTLAADLVMKDVPSSVLRLLDNPSLSCMANAAVDCHRFDILLTILRAGIGVSRLKRNGYDFLFAVSYEGHFECIKALARSDVDVGLTRSPTPESEELPFICAAISKHSTSAVRALVEAGVKLDSWVIFEPEIGNITGFACMAGTPEVAELVFELGGHLDNIPPEVRTNVLLQTAKNGFDTIVLELLNRGVRPNRDVLAEVARFNMHKCVVPLLKANDEGPIDRLKLPDWDSAMLFMTHENFEAARLLLGPKHELSSGPENARCRTILLKAMMTANFRAIQLVVEVFGKACLRALPFRINKPIVELAEPGSLESIRRLCALGVKLDQGPEFQGGLDAHAIRKGRASLAAWLVAKLPLKMKCVAAANAVASLEFGVLKAILDELFVGGDVAEAISGFRDALEADRRRISDELLALVHHPAMFRPSRRGAAGAAAGGAPLDPFKHHQEEYDKWVEVARRVADGAVGLDEFQDALKSPFPSPDLASLECSGAPMLWHLAGNESPKALSLAKALMRCGASPTMQGSSGTPIVRAAALGTVTMVAAMLKAIPEMGTLAQEDAEGETAFTVALKRGNADVLAELAKAPMLPVRELARGWTALMLACSLKNKSAVKVVLSKCAGEAESVDFETLDGMTALQLAIDNCPDAVGELLRRGACPNRVLKHASQTPLARAVDVGAAEAVSALVADSRLQLNAVCPGLKRTPLELACANGASEVALLLLAAGAEPSCPSFHGWHCGVASVLLGQLDTAHAILSSDLRGHGCLKTNPDSAYQALAVLAEHGRFDTATRLLECGSMSNASKQQVATVWTFAVARGWGAALCHLEDPSLQSLPDLAAELEALTSARQASTGSDSVAAACASKGERLPRSASVPSPSAKDSAAAAASKSPTPKGRIKSSKFKGKPSKGKRRGKS